MSLIGDGRIVGESPRDATIFTLLVVAVFTSGVVAGDELLASGFPVTAFGLLVLLAVGTAIQAFVNRSVALSLALSLALPLGVWSGTFLTGAQPARPPSLYALCLGATFSVLFGMTGHLVGMEVARWRDATGRRASSTEQWAIVGMLLLVVGIFLFAQP